MTLSIDYAKIYGTVLLFTKGRLNGLIESLNFRLQMISGSFVTDRISGKPELSVASNRDRIKFKDNAMKVSSLLEFPCLT